MRLLIDTHILIWADERPRLIAEALLAAMRDEANEIVVSAATIWEIAIKQAAARLRFPLDRFDDTIDRMGCDILPILPSHGIAAGALPRYHNDPFDRMLIAQAQAENLVLVSNEVVFDHYGITRLWK